MLALTLGACSQNAGKLNKGGHLSGNASSASTADSRLRLGFGKSGGRWLRKGGSLQGRGTDNSKYDNLWDRLFDLYDLPPIEHEDIDRELSWFINHPTYIDRVQQRAEPFLFSIVSAMDHYDVPGEIALLPVIESAFQPHAVSPANAAGIWQFIPSTGRHYGLKQSRSYDGRRDIYASTRAAIKYLKKLHNDFDGDWLLAIAAYNCGEGAVGRAIQRNEARRLPTDFWSLDLPQETRSYVPRLLAVAKLFLDSDQYGIDLKPLPNKARFKPIKVTTPIDLAEAADAADMSLEQMYELNPGFKHRVTDLDGSYRLYIPAEKTADFKQALVRLAQEGRMQAESPAAEQGSEPADSAASNPTRLAMASSPEETPVSLLSEARPTDRDEPSAPSVQRTRRMEKEETVRESRSEPRESAASSRPAPAQHNTEEPEAKAGKSGKPATYKVERGDTLFSIARKSGMDIQELAKLNHLSEKSGVRYGQKLKLLMQEDDSKPLVVAKAEERSVPSGRHEERSGKKHAAPEAPARIVHTIGKKGARSGHVQASVNEKHEKAEPKREAPKRLIVASAAEHVSAPRKSASHADSGKNQHGPAAARKTEPRQEHPAAGKKPAAKSHR